MLKNLERAKALRGAILAAPRGVESYESNLGYKWDPFFWGGGGSNVKDPGMSFNFGIISFFMSLYISPETDMDTHKGLGQRELIGQSFGGGDQT